MKNELYQFTGKARACDIYSTRMQYEIINVKTGSIHFPIMTKRNKTFNKFHNASIQGNENKFYFLCELRRNFSSCNLRNIQFIDTPELQHEYAEWMI